ncbi:MAG: glutathione S-transferase family protein, partial [Rhodospirillaceae bacterium]|nr:glutathione S-transferase family protein [Rhodospirillaceae bacterium]
AHISAVDSLGDVPWADYKSAKNWYARIKSRPSFQGILADSIPGLPAPKHYADPDF